MRFVVQVSADNRAKAWGVLVRHSAGTALPDGTFVVSEEAVGALSQTGIPFKEIGREPGDPAAAGIALLESLSMYERFTDQARRVMQLANQEAHRFNHEYIGTEHILLGLIKEGAGVAAKVLNNLNIDLRKIRHEVVKNVAYGPDLVTSRRLPQTPRAKKAIEYAIEVARNLNHDHVGTEHLLLGILSEQEGVAAQVLTNLGLALEDTRAEVWRIFGKAPVQIPSVAQGPRRPNQPDPGTEPEGLPEEVRASVRRLDAEIERLTFAKEEAVAGQGFEKAGSLRDKVDKLRKKRAKLLMR